MNTTQREQIMQRWNVIQHELLPELRGQVGALTPRLEKVSHTREGVRVEEFTGVSWCGIGRPLVDRAWQENAFVAKVVLQLTTTFGLIERLSVDRALQIDLWLSAVQEAAFGGHLPTQFLRVCASGAGPTDA